ncbi:hypothetical protein VNO77_42363 [Canavalia gladiata]|uniref:Uncharacterized protein n=1 Tax=Canavalia gladiata TaxID=3824 RepID=A0AAN9K355_CANGL
MLSFLYHQGIKHLRKHLRKSLLPPLRERTTHRCPHTTIVSYTHGLHKFEEAPVHVVRHKGTVVVIDQCTNLEDLILKRLRAIQENIEVIGSMALSLKSICLKELVNGQSFAEKIQVSDVGLGGIFNYLSLYTLHYEKHSRNLQQDGFEGNH